MKSDGDGNVRELFEGINVAVAIDDFSDRQAEYRSVLMVGVRDSGLFLRTSGITRLDLAYIVSELNRLYANIGDAE